ncbi:MAG: DNA repair protein RadA [Devosiaceae bacterium]|nr:DNA repair protein RadA [Devosiaceae bacterium MH13]
MAKRRASFVCQNCGTTHSKWTGRCDACGAWNSLVEESASGGGALGGPSKGASIQGRAVTLSSLDHVEKPLPRLATGIAELDRVTGGGFVRGSALLVGGDPGIGKSTLLMQVAAGLAGRSARVVYISGEEALGQVRLRAERLGVSQRPVHIASETNLEDILATLDAGDVPDLVVLDSIQTLWSSSVDSAPGTVTQVRSCAQQMIRYAKRTGACVILVGHVTKDGQIAGPRVVEHMVDAVLYFEGDRTHHFRILRGVKNRFGATDEIGVFEMTGGGLQEVGNPSELFLGDRLVETPGSVVFAGLEGTRPILVEIQALVAPSALGTPRRAVVGWDSNRLAMVLAVLEARCGVRFSGHDVYLAVAGGLRLTEPAADLAVAGALVASLTGLSLPASQVYFGEIGLSGAIRSAPQAVLRMKEAARLGFEEAVTAPLAKERDANTGLRLNAHTRLESLVADLAASAAAQKTQGAGAGRDAVPLQAAQ